MSSESDTIRNIENFIASLEFHSRGIAVELAVSLATSLSEKYDSLPRQEQDQLGRAFSSICKTACLLSKEANHNLLLGRVIEAYARGIKETADPDTQGTVEALQKLAKIVLTP